MGALLRTWHYLIWSHNTRRDRDYASPWFIEEKIEASRSQCTMEARSEPWFVWLQAYTIPQGSANYIPQANCGPPIFSKRLYWNTATLTHRAYSCVYAKTAELHSCERHPVTCKATTIYHQAFHRNLANPCANDTLFHFPVQSLIGKRTLKQTFKAIYIIMF